MSFSGVHADGFLRSHWMQITATSVSFPWGISSSDSPKFFTKFRAKSSLACFPLSFPTISFRAGTHKINMEIVTGKTACEKFIPIHRITAPSVCLTLRGSNSSNFFISQNWLLQSTCNNSFCCKNIKKNPAMFCVKLNFNSYCNRTYHAIWFHEQFQHVMDIP